MKQIIINSTSDILYPAFENIYKSSFPIFEQRTKRQQEVAFCNPKYKLAGYTDERGYLIGFIAGWHFETYTYIEHFAISAKFRGNGYGSSILHDFLACASHDGKTVVLEIDPPVDGISISRQHFYERAGMSINPFNHKHPPYRKGYHPHPLRIMSAPKEISEKQYQLFAGDLKNVVMHF